MVSFLTCCVLIYACMQARVRDCRTACLRECVHLYVCCCWCCCCRNILWSESCDILPCCCTRWQAECIRIAHRCHSVFCRLSATSALSLWRDWSHELTSKFGFLYASPSFTMWASVFWERKTWEQRWEQIWGIFLKIPCGGNSPHQEPDWLCISKTPVNYVIKDHYYDFSHWKNVLSPKSNSKM